MKPSTLAVALLTVPLGAHAQQHVGGGVGAQYKKMKTIRGSSAPLLGDTDVDMDLVEKCLANKADGDCNSRTDIDCTWCEAGAVPSACYPTMMASSLPVGVFECSKTTAAKAEFAEQAATILESAAPEEKKASKKTSETFMLKEGVTLTLDASEVDKNFCDASSPLSLAGYMNIKGSQFDTENDKSLFYWFFEKRDTSQLPAGNPKVESGDDVITPLIVWLTGGPGCSSSLALLAENGPCSVKSDGTTTEVNPYSWTESAHVLWLDQPADVGYSYGQGNDVNEEMISEDAYYFLQAFFKSAAGSKYKDAPLHIIGESYGGHYAPAIAHRILKGNQVLKDGDDLARLNLSGLAIGNGLTDPEEQYKYYAEMAYNNSHDLKIIDEKTYEMMSKAVPACTIAIHECNAGDGIINTGACQAAFLACNMALTSPYRLTGKNPYDISKDCGTNPLCYDFSHIETFMNAETTKNALHVMTDKHNPTWKTCNMLVNLKFHVDWMKNFAPYVGELLDAGIPTLIYAGDLDFVCNYMGNRAWSLKLPWAHHDDFTDAVEHEWTNKAGKPAGLARTANGLTFLQVYEAGHMVPSDQPGNALEMITQHLAGQAF